jgi:hypothetical protein
VTSFSRQTYLPFAPEVYPIERLLSVTNNSAVGEFKVFDIPSDMVAVGNRASPLIEVVAVKCSRKRSNHTILSNEIHFLKAISSLGGHPNLPTILFYSPNETQFGMTPSGNRVNPSFLEDQRQLPYVLSDILSAIIWLHDHNILHRDICWDNIVYGKSTHRPTLVDFGAAIHLPHEPVEVAYLGGFICCPPRLLADIPKPYIPEKSDDYHAYILLANSMLFPGSVAGFHCASVIDPDDDEVSRLQQLWCGLEESRVWDRYVKAAVQGNHAMMKTLPGVVFRLECQPKTVSADATLGFDELMVEQWATTYIPDTYEEDDSIPDTYDDDIPDAYEEQEYFDESE